MNIPPAFQRWAPPDSPWSDWVKPVLFASFQGAPIFADVKVAPVAEPDVTAIISAIPRAERDTFVIVDQPGITALAAGLELARRGFRPVVLFNGVDGIPALVPVDVVAGALFAWADTLAALPLAPDAPPAFLLDSRRMSGRPAPGMFDNRWVVVPEDLPSANRLLHAGHRRCLLALDGNADDLQHVLLRFQKAGIELARAAPDGTLTSYSPRRPTMFGSLFARALVAAGLMRSSAGGFGGVIPEPSRGGYG